MDCWRGVRALTRWLLGATGFGAALAGGLSFAQDPPPAVLPPAADVAGPAVKSPPTTPGTPAVPPAAAPSPAATPPSASSSATTPPAAQSAADETPKPFDWTKVPAIQPTPRVGYIIVPPPGPGYFSLDDLLTGNCRPKAPKFPFGTTSLYATSAFNYDFRYLDEPDNTQHDWSDCYKRVHFGECCDWL